MKNVRAIVIGLLVATAAFGQDGTPELTQETVLSADGVAPGGTILAAVKVHLNAGYHVNSDAPLDDFLIPTKVSLELPEGVTVNEIVYPEAIRIDQLGSQLAVFEEEFAIGLSLGITAAASPGSIDIPGTLRYQACNDTQCFRPMSQPLLLTVNVVAEGTETKPLHEALFKKIAFTGSAGGTVGMPEAPVEIAQQAPMEEGDVVALLADFDTLATDAGYLPADKFLAFIDAAESGETRQGWFEGRGPIAIVALILVGGLALNLTPCVLPMIPINLAIIGAGAQAGSRTRGFMLGGAYGLAMAAVYGVLGLVVILTAGTFGTINSSPWFNIGIAALFVVLGLAMFDVIKIDFSKYQTKFNLGGKEKGTFFLAFGMGGIAALLAGACVAPVVIQVIVFSSDLYAKGTTLALALPFLLGVGMALPWPIAGAGLSFLPKPGMWMVRVKQAFGVLILGFAVYYGYLGYELMSQRWVDQSEVAESANALYEEGWYSSLSEGLAAAKAENKPVLIDLWATWCKNCLTMDKTTFQDEAVLARLEDYVKIKFQAENPDASPAKEVMKHFGAFGLPTYAIVRAK